MTGRNLLQPPNSAQLEATVGHPGRLLDELFGRVARDKTPLFKDVQLDWLNLMWAIDSYRIAGIPPEGMGRLGLPPAPRLAAIYRSKGNWFSTLLATLLQNRTDQEIRPRIKVQGFSQLHQIDLAWPARQEDPLICVETKVTGAPAYGSTPARSALADFANRRKELKFASTDLKLFRRQQDTFIEHWGVWREHAPPKTYLLWGARLKASGRGKDDVSRLILEAQALVNTYLDGAGIFAWRDRPGGGYEAVLFPAPAQVATLDDVLYRIASEIRVQAGPTGRPPAPITPSARVVDVNTLTPDSTGEGPTEGPV